MTDARRAQTAWHYACFSRIFGGQIMEDLSAAEDLLWEEQNRSDRTQKGSERREWLRKFVLGSALIVLTLAAATLLTSLGAVEKLRF